MMSFPSFFFSFLSFLVFSFVRG